jgi:exopolyphosphatase / guanosine-5'-triphosphate,3'-diphosphate pyrophosphatase
MDEPRADPSATLAAIDIGSNSFRLELGHFVDGRYRRIDYVKQTVRLGAGLDEQGMLGPEAAQRGLNCLAGFASRLAGLPASQVRAVATQTLREARNRNAFLERGKKALGHEIEVIAGREEARLIYAGVTLLQPADESLLVIDIGGRSTEMILGQGRVPSVAESFAVGCVSLSQRFFGDGRVTESAFRHAMTAAGAEFEEAQQAFASGQWSHVLGASGTAGAVSQLLAASQVSDGRITPQGVAWLMERCVAARQCERLELPGLKPDRRAVLPGGLAILQTLLENFEIDELWPARGALRHGVIGELHAALGDGARVPQADLRDATVSELQRRFGVDRAQAGRVALVALALFDALPGQRRADRPPARRELAWACALHELGQMVSHHDHHRHSAYLMAKVDAPGFSQNQQNRLSQLLLGQRGGLRKLGDALDDEGFAWQLLCLRVAVIACHARDAVQADALRLRAAAHTARLGWSDDWARAKPRTVYLLREEAQAWARAGTLKLELPD